MLQTTSKSKSVLYCYTKETQDLFDTFTNTGTDYKTPMNKLDAYFSPKKNVDYEIFQFRQAKQQESETVDQFVTRLRKLAQTCEFAELEKELKSAVIQHCRSKQLRRYALREEELTLDKLLSKARALEASEHQAKGMEGSMAQMAQTANSIVQQDRRKPRKSQYIQSRQSQQPPPSQCRKCGFLWPHTKGQCPATGQTCRACGKLNHFARMCLSTKAQKSQQTTPQQGGHQSHIRQLTVQSESTSDSSEEEFLFTLEQDGGNTTVPQINVMVNGNPIKMTVDTGASTNIIDEITFGKLEAINLQS